MALRYTATDINSEGKPDRREVSYLEWGRAVAEFRVRDENTSGTGTRPSEPPRRLGMSELRVAPVVISPATDPR
jgi:hypothetical protein